MVDEMTDWHSEALRKYFCLITTHRNRRRKNVLANLFLFLYDETDTYSKEMCDEII